MEDDIALVRTHGIPLLPSHLLNLPSTQPTMVSHALQPTRADAGRALLLSLCLSSSNAELPDFQWPATAFPEGAL